MAAAKNDRPERPDRPEHVPPGQVIHPHTPPVLEFTTDAGARLGVPPGSIVAAMEGTEGAPVTLYLLGGYALSVQDSYEDVVSAMEGDEEDDVG